MLNEPGQSPYDLHFKFLGFPVRVTWTFWLLALLLGWGWSQGMHNLARRSDIESPGAPALLIIWVASVFVSILVHELGHALAYRKFGQRAHIVLYHFGGLAICSSFTSWDGARRGRTSANDDLLIAAAGPAAQLLLAIVVGVIGYKLNVAHGWLIDLLRIPGADVSQWKTIVWYAVFDSLVVTSVFWAIINLAPVLPMDGGQIMYNLMVMFNVRESWLKARQVSIAAGIAIGIFFAMTFGGMSGIMFFLFAANNWQEIQQGGRGF